MNKKILGFLVLACGLVLAKDVVSIDGYKITQEDLNPMKAMITQGRYNSYPDSAKEKIDKIVVEQVINQTLIANEATKAKLEDDKEFKSKLEDSTKKLKKQILVDLWMKKKLDEIKVSKKELEEYFKKNKSKYVKKAEVRARHILVKTEKKAKELIKKLKKSGSKIKETFIDLAKKESTGPSKANGGDLGYFTKDKMVPEFATASFSMKKGEFSKKPVKTQFGYHIIYIEDKKAKKAYALADIKENLKEEIKMTKFKTKVDSLLKDLKKKSKIVYYN